MQMLQNCVGLQGNQINYFEYDFGSFIWETTAPFTCTLIFETLQTFYIHKRLYYTLHEI